MQSRKKFSSWRGTNKALKLTTHQCAKCDSRWVCCFGCLGAQNEGNARMLFPFPSACPILKRKVFFVEFFHSEDASWLEKNRDLSTRVSTRAAKLAKAPTNLVRLSAVASRLRNETDVRAHDGIVSWYPTNGNPYYLVDGNCSKIDVGWHQPKNSLK